MSKTTKKLKEYSITVLIFIGILALSFSLGRQKGETENAFFAMVIGLCSVIWFRPISHFFAKVNTLLPSPFPFINKWITYNRLRRYYEILSIVIGTFFFLIGLVILLSRI